MEGIGNLAGGKFFLLSQIAAFYMYTEIINTVFQRFTIFILQTSNRILIFFEKNLSFFIYFIVLFFPGCVLDFMMYHIQLIFFQ